MKKSFVLYKDSYDYLKELTDQEFGILMKAVFEYSISKKELPKSHQLYLAFAPIKNQLDRDDEKYKTISETNKINGSKGGKRTQANATKRKRTKANQADNDSDSGNDSVTEIDIVKESVSIILPSHLSVFIFWLEYKKDIKDFYTSEKSLVQLAKKFNQRSVAVCESVVNSSVENGWKGLFWDKAKPEQKQNTDITNETPEQRRYRLISQTL